MSFYAKMVGEISYPDVESFNTVLNRLVDGGWIDGKRSNFYKMDQSPCRFIDERENPIEDESCIDPVNRIIRIPIFYHRNLSRVNFFPTGREKGWVVGSSKDGVFCGWNIKNGVETNYDLKKWAMEKGLGKPPRDSQDLSEWQSMVQEEFISNFCKFTRVV